MATTETDDQGPEHTPDASEASAGEAFRRSGASGLSVAVVRVGQPIWARGSGFADLARTPRRRGRFLERGARLPGGSLGVVMMGNTTRYDHESILDTIVRLYLRERRP